MTEEEAITELHWIQNHGFKYPSDLPGTERIIEAIDAAVSALKSQRWIPVEEKMPELIPCNAGTAYSEAVVVLTKDEIVCTAVWNGKLWLADFDYWEALGEVTHWKSILPLPPKEESL